MPLSTHQATTAAAMTALLLIFANGDHLRSSLTSYSFSHSSIMQGSTGRIQASTLPPDARLAQLEASISAVRSMMVEDKTQPERRAASIAASHQPEALASLQTPQTQLLPPPPPTRMSTPVAWKGSPRLLAHDEYLQRVPAGGVAFVAIANSAYSQMGVNWALLILPVLAKIGQSERAVLAALDEQSQRAFLSRELPTIRVGLGALNASADGQARSGRSDDFRWQMGSFRSMGVTKAEIILWLLRAGRDACLSDVDSAWIVPPYAMLDSLPEADVLSGTDCLHVKEDDDRSSRPRVVSRCGHHVGSNQHCWFNTGVMFFRANRPGALAMAQEWRDRMAREKDPNKQIDDQLTFNQMVGSVGDPLRQAKPIYPVAGARPDGKVIYAGARVGSAAQQPEWKIAPLSARVVCTAHVYHVQQSMEPRECMILHLTFVEGWPKNPAKHWRLREAGLFPVSPEGFDGQFLTYTPPQPTDVPPERGLHIPQAFSGLMPDRTTDGRGWSVATAFKHAPRLDAHVKLVDRHIAALRNAMGIATALKRTLVLPKFLCLCERAESPYAILPSCILEGASTTLPFICPLESLFDVARDLARILPIRPWTFLNGSVHVPPPGAKPFDPRTDVTAVRWQPNTVAAAAAASPAAVSAAGAPDGSSGAMMAARRILLRRGLSDMELRADLKAAGADTARVLHLESAEGGVFGGFESIDTATRFHRLIMDALVGGWSATWCCTSNDKPRGTIQFKRPLPLPAGEESKVANVGTRGPEIPQNRQCYWIDRTCNDKL